MDIVAEYFGLISVNVLNALAATSGGRSRLLEGGAATGSPRSAAGAGVNILNYTVFRR